MGLTNKVQFTLKPSAVPSVCIESKSDKPEPHLERPTREESAETMESSCQRDHVKPHDGPTSSSEESGRIPIAPQGSPIPRRVSSSTDKPHAAVSIHGQMQPKQLNNDLIKEKAERLQIKGKYVVNERRLLQLFNRKCPSCGCKLQMQKVTYGLLIILNQQCLQCDYRHQWKSQVDANVPTNEVPTETQQVSSTDATQSSVTGVPEIVAVIDEERDDMDESEGSSDQDEMESDEDWRPARVPQQKATVEDETEEDDEDEEGEGDDEYPPLASKHSQLCTECGRFFNKFRPHTCEHKIKPFSCNICGKRFVTDIALSRHSRIHDANYEFRCKFCHVTFKTKADKFSHEQIHMTDGQPYKCPDCSESFASNKERRIHIQDHRGPPQLKCEICGIEFCWPLALKRHLAVHTGEKPHKCSVCDRGFNQPSHLKSHMRLHTGERPFKCQHCDKCFNHNVSLKSHMQRYHTSNSDGDNTVDAQDNGNKRGADSGLDNVEEEQDTEEEVQTEGLCKPKYKKKSTGRPKGRPKNYESNPKKKQRVQRLKRTQCNDEENEDEQSDSDISFDPAEEEEKRAEKATKNTATSRRRAKKLNSEMSDSSQNTGQSLRKRRGRPRKKL
uniref:uncharacterized protein n=1 Tax=Semicossyphus pulcher TaxID=241346 RepID=UPI0037E87BD2